MRKAFINRIALVSVLAVSLTGSAIAGSVGSTMFENEITSLTKSEESWISRKAWGDLIAAGGLLGRAAIIDGNAIARNVLGAVTIVGIALAVASDIALWETPGQLGNMKVGRVHVMEGGDEEKRLALDGECKVLGQKIFQGQLMEYSGLAGILAGLGLAVLLPDSTPRVASSILVSTFIWVGAGFADYGSTQVRVAKEELGPLRNELLNYGTGVVGKKVKSQ